MFCKSCRTTKRKVFAEPSVEVPHYSSLFFLPLFRFYYLLLFLQSFLTIVSLQVKKRSFYNCLFHPLFTLLLRLFLKEYTALQMRSSTLLFSFLKSLLFVYLNPRLVVVILSICSLISERLSEFQ